MRQKHAHTGVLLFFLPKKKCGKKLSHKTITMRCHCKANVKYRFLSKTPLMKAAICRLRK